jgi:hypothetical protein
MDFSTRSRVAICGGGTLWQPRRARGRTRRSLGRGVVPLGQPRRTQPCPRTRRRIAYRVRAYREPRLGNVARMPGRPNYAYQWRPASGAQLWRLNRLGRLRVVDDGVVLSAAEARALIEAELARLGTDRFPDTRGARASQVEEA